MARPWFLAYLSLQIFVLLCLLSTIASSAYYSIRKKFTFAILEPVLDRIEASDTQLEPSLDPLANPDHGRRSARSVWTGWRSL